MTGEVSALVELVGFALIVVDDVFVSILCGCDYWMGLLIHSPCWGKQQNGTAE